MDISIRAREAEDTDESDRLRECAAHSRVIVGTGSSSTGKTFVSRACAENTLDNGGSVLLAAPSGNHVARMGRCCHGNENVFVDTCRSAFGLHLAEPDAMPILIGG